MNDKNLQILRHHMDGEQTNPYTFTEKLRLSHLRREAKRRAIFNTIFKAVKLQVIRAFAALGLITLLAAAIVPVVNTFRGHFAFGGEWLWIITCGVFFWCWLGGHHNDE